MAINVFVTERKGEMEYLMYFVETGSSELFHDFVFLDNLGESVSLSSFNPHFCSLFWVPDCSCNYFGSHIFESAIL